MEVLFIKASGFSYSKKGIYKGNLNLDKAIRIADYKEGMTKAHVRTICLEYLKQTNQI